MMSDPAAALPTGVTVFERGWLSSNNVLLVDADHAALIDSGYGAHAPQTVALVRAELGDRPLDILLNTHLHSDHCGGNAALQSAHPGVRTHIPPGQAAFVRDWDPEALSYVPTGQQCPRFGYDDVLRAGSSIRLGGQAWEIHAAPGHDPHAVILFEPGAALLISGDALWENGFGVVFPELEGEPGFDEVGATLDLIESLAPRVVIPGHGRPFNDVPRAVDTARKRLSGLVQAPARHARHAGKVLIKFKLLELQVVAREALVAWALRTRYFTAVHHRYFSHVPAKAWLLRLLDELEQSGALRQESQADGDPLVFNC